MKGERRLVKVGPGSAGFWSSRKALVPVRERLRAAAHEYSARALYSAAWAVTHGSGEMEESERGRALDDAIDNLERVAIEFAMSDEARERAGNDG